MASTKSKTKKTTATPKRAPAKGKAKRRRKPPRQVRKPGRPPKITQYVTVTMPRPDGKGELELQVTTGEGVVMVLEAGTSIKTAAEALGLHESTVHDWMARAEEHRGQDNPPASEMPYIEFSEAVTRAREQVVHIALRGILEAGKTDWRAWAWFLERSRPDEYGRRTRFDHGGIGPDGEHISLAELFARSATDPPTEDGDGDG